MVRRGTGLGGKRKSRVLPRARKAAVDDKRVKRRRDTSPVGTSELSLASRDIRAYREQQLLAQGGICPLCGRVIQHEEAALDHCHKTGNIRRVLHRWCNSVLGRIENWASRSGTDKVEFLKAVVRYIEHPQTDIKHPTHGKKRRRRRK